MSDFPDVEVIESAFETFDAPDVDGFDLVFAATAWHWLDPATRCRRTWELLVPGGHLAFWSATHVFPEDGDPFFAGLQEIYEIDASRFTTCEVVHSSLPGAVVLVTPVLVEVGGHQLSKVLHFE